MRLIYKATCIFMLLFYSKSKCHNLQTVVQKVSFFVSVPKTVQVSEFSSRLGKGWKVPNSTVITMAVIFKCQLLKWLYTFYGIKISTFEGKNQVMGPKLSSTPPSTYKCLINIQNMCYTCIKDGCAHFTMYFSLEIDWLWPLKCILWHFTLR